MTYESNTLAISIRKELEPFFFSFAMLGAKNEKFQQFKSNYRSFKDSYRNAKQKEQLVTEGIAPDWMEPEGYEGVPFIAAAMFAYLGLVETVANCVVDILVMLLVANGRDFHVESNYGPRIKHATSISSLKDGKVTLSTKLDFLRENGVKALTNVIDTTLRNDIAHLKFNLEEADIFVSFNRKDSNGKTKKIPAKIILKAGIQDLLEGLDVTVDELTKEFDKKFSL